MLICLLLSALIYLLAVREPPPRWLATYFSRPSLEGRALVREDRQTWSGWPDAQLVQRLLHQGQVAGYRLFVGVEVDGHVGADDREAMTSKVSGGVLWCPEEARRS